MVKKFTAASVELLCLLLATLLLDLYVGLLIPASEHLKNCLFQVTVFATRHSSR